MIDRVDPVTAGDELTTLTEYVDWFRATLLTKVEGLTDEQARLRSVPPSTLCLMGLVRHMADVERTWFRRRFAGEAIGPQFYSDDDPDGDMNPRPADTLADALRALDHEISAARRITATSRLDDVGVQLVRGEPISMRWILVHMIEEYGRHCGHADLLRESIDGRTGA